ncbi:DNA-directed DNA polymerase [Tanacetum coccineum]
MIKMLKDIDREDLETLWKLVKARHENTRPKEDYERVEGLEYLDTADSGKKKETKAFTFYRMETEEMIERYITPCFVSGLHAYDGEINLEYEKNMISNEFVIKLLLDYEEKDWEKVVKKELNGIITIYPGLVSLNDDSDDDGEAILASVDDSDLPQPDVTGVSTFGCNMGKKPRPIIETLKFSDQHKKLLDNVLLDRLKPDEEVELEEEVATKEVIRSYKAIKEKNDPGVFVLPILIEANFDFHALADTGSNINVLPYCVNTNLGRDQVKPVSHIITTLDHSKAEPIGILKDMLCQVGVTTILEKFLILDIPVDQDVPIVVGRSFLYTCGSLLNTIKGTTSIFDGVCHQKFYVAKVRNNHGESDSNDEEEYYLKRDENGKPFYGPNRAKYLNCDDLIDQALALQEAINPFKKVCVWKKMIVFLGSLPVPLQNSEWIPSYSDNFAKKVMEMGNGTLKPQVCTAMKPVVLDQKEPVNMRPWRKLCSHVFIMILCIKIEAILEIKVYEIGGEEEIFNSEAWRRAFDINEPIYIELCHEFYATYNFDKDVTDDELMTKKLIKFRLEGRGHTLTLLEFACRLGLYHSAEISDGGFEVYFQGGLHSDENFNTRKYWLNISSEEELHLSKSLASNIRSFFLSGLRERDLEAKESMIYYGQFITRMAKRMNLLTDEVLDGLSAPTYCRALDATTLKVLIGSIRRFIAEDLAPGVPRDQLERMSHRQLYHTDRYAGVFEFMVGHYGVPLQGVYAPPVYDEEPQQQDQEYATRTPNPKVAKKKKKKGKQIVGESSTPKQSLKIRIKQRKATLAASLPPIDDVENRILEEDVEKLLEGDEECNRDEFAYTMLLSNEESSNRIEPRSHKENSEEIVDDDEKNDDDKHYDAKIDEDKDDDDDDHIDHALIRTRRTGNTLMPDAPSHVPSQPTSSRHTHLRGFVTRMSRRQVDEYLREIFPKLATSATNDLMKDYLPWLVTDVIKKEREQSKVVVPALISQEFVAHAPKIIEELFKIHMQNTMKSDLQSQVASDLWNVLKANFEKSSASIDSCRYDAFRKLDHEDHLGDDAPLEGGEEGERRNPNDPLRSYVIWETVHDFQLGIESYQIKINLTDPTLTIPSIDELTPYSTIDIPFVVLKEVKLKVFETKFKMNTPLLDDLDLKIMQAYEREIEKRLKHRRQMRRWESFVNGRPILHSKERRE